MKLINATVWANVRMEYDTVDEFVTDVLKWTNEGFTFSLSSYTAQDVGTKPFMVQYQRAENRSSRAAFAVRD